MKESTPHQLTTPEQTARLLGMSVEEMTALFKREGILNADGSPTQKALDEGSIILFNRNIINDN